MSTAYHDPHWYLDASHFCDRRKHNGLLKIVTDTYDERLRGTPDSGEDSLVHGSALEHYLTTYGSPELPPSWLMVETLTIGQLAGAYRNLKRRADRTAVARSSWARRLHGLVSDRSPMHLRGMGIADGWANDPFWRRHLD